MEEKFILDWEEQKLNPKFKQEIDDIKQVITQTSVDFHNYIFPKYINNYKKYLWFVAERLATIESWQSNVNYPMVSSAVDTMFSNIFDFGYQIGVSEEALKKQCTRAFDFRNTWKRVLEEVTKEALIIWKWYAKDYFIKEKFKDTFFWKTIEKDIKMPSMQYLSAFDVMYDRSKWLDSSAYKIVRTFMTWDGIIKKVLPLVLAEYSPEAKKSTIVKFKKILKSYKDQFSSRFSMYDYNPVKALTSTSQWFNSDVSTDYYSLSTCASQAWLLAWYWDDSVQEDSKNYFLNTNKSTYELVEYVTNDKKYIFVNWNLVYYWDRKYNLWEIREVTFSKIPGTWNANGISDKLTVLQDLQNTLWNAFIDNLKLNLWPMFKISGNIPMWKSGKLDFKAFKAFKTNWSQDIEKIQLWVTDFAPMNFMQMVEWTALKESWMSPYVTGWGWAIERTQAWVDVKFNQYKSKLTPLTDSIDQMMWNITRNRVFMLFKFFTREELLELNIAVEDVFEKDKDDKEKFKTITINWLDIMSVIDENNISFTYNSLDKITMENNRETIIMNLQYMLQYVPSQINMKELWKILSWKTFDAENLLQEPKPKPPAQQYGWQQYEEELPVETETEEEPLNEDDLLANLKNIM
jgi:hypothetical protein